jgi:hypothetical protein
MDQIANRRATESISCEENPFQPNVPAEIRALIAAMPTAERKLLRARCILSAHH